MEEARYLDGSYLAHNPTWGAEDSPWKAGQIHKILERNSVAPRSIAEIGCGAGGILQALSQKYPDAQCHGFDISPLAFAMAQRHSSSRLHFHLADLLESRERFDVLLAIDVAEHVPDYLGFLKRCRERASFQVYHFPLELHVSAVLRDAHLYTREKVGHLHYFSAATALATLRDTGHEVVDHFFTAGTMGLFKHHPAFKTAVANVPRWFISRFSEAWASKLLGGYSLMILCR